MILLITILCIAGIIAYYLKFRHDEKKRKKTGHKNEMEPLDFIVTDNTGYHKVKNP